MNMEIREYDAADEAALLALWARCELSVPWNDPRADIARKLAVDRDLFLVGLIDGRLVASVMGGYDGHRGWLYYVAVDPEFRKQGYGRRIIGAVETRLHARGCPKINLQVRSHNRKVIAFYESLGYIESDLISMGKRLVDDADS
ncbi:MAG TPA: GNAT family acetyltransferase [Gammaproteobacteria bacterium]|nr:GNAT family acetyltransferase [Gammaproteobacteria bacterium]